jgi:Xaa-Pro aminopeptidase
MPQLQFSIDWPAMISDNVERLCNELAAEDVELLFINNIDSVRYVTGYSPVSAPVLVHSNWAVVNVASRDVTLFGFNFYLDSIKERFPWIKDVRAVPADIGAEIARLASGARRVGFDSYVPYFTGTELAGRLDGTEVIDASAILSRTRAIKSPAEVEILRRSVAIAEIGMNAGIGACREGVCEFEAAAESEYAMRRAGAEGFPFMNVITSGENVAIMQELSTDRIMRRGDLVMLDLGCLFEGYNSDFARSVVVGDAPTEEQRRMYQVVHTALGEMTAAMGPGVEVNTLDAIARRVIDEGGFGPWTYTYFVGHGIGMSPWELPLVDPETTTALEPGMVIDIEPGIHKPGVGGVRLEDTILITETGCEVLTRTGFSAALL